MEPRRYRHQADNGRSHERVIASWELVDRELDLCRELLREFPDGAANGTLLDVVEEIEQQLHDLDHKVA
jgi:hypothetical protein